MRHVQKDGYHLLEWPERPDLTLPVLWRAVPELVLGRHLVCTSFDSGSLALGPQEVAAGWRMVGSLAHSPPITALDQVPHDQFYEWLAFDGPVEVSAFDTMVNYTGFTPPDFGWQEKREHYWRQVLLWQPRHIIAENDHAYVVTKDEAVVHLLQQV